MLLLRELIVRYLAWVQTGGQRASLAGLESLAREDTFELEEETWDFETGVRALSPAQDCSDHRRMTTRWWLSRWAMSRRAPSISKRRSAPCDSQRVRSPHREETGPDA